MIILFLFGDLMLEIIPVIDLMNSLAVSGKSGNRETYTPLQTVYASSADPMEIAISLKAGALKRCILQTWISLKETETITSLK